MGVLSDRLDGMRVRASSPDGMIVGELRNRTEVYLSFVDGTYRRYGKQALEDQLAGLARRLWAGRMREYYAAVSAAFGETIRGESPATGQRDVAYYAARDDLVAEGRSADGRVYVATQGMRNWTVRIADGTLRALTEEEFAVRVREAAGELIRDQLGKIRELKQQFYD
ncbi:MAG TPA: hypothetical protein VIS06_11950 [Mycobacteriales bacterium]|jgi:hypothetical protein